MNVKREIRSQKSEVSPDYSSGLRPLPSDLYSLLSCLAFEIRALSRQIELDSLKARAEFAQTQATLQTLQTLQTIMAKTNAELVQQAKDQAATLAHIATETDALKALIVDLQAAVANQANPSQELTDAMQAVTDQLATEDAKDAS